MGEALVALTEGYSFDKEYGSVQDLRDKEYVDCTAHLCRSPMRPEMPGLFKPFLFLLRDSLINKE